MTIETVGVVGLGTMGAGIVEVFAKAGYRVVAMDAVEAGVERGRSIIEASLDKAVAKGKMEQGARDEVLARISWNLGLEQASTCQLVVEAAFENADVKKQIFATLDETAPHAVLATNTSSLSVTEIAEVVQDPSRVIGVHFFNPAPVQKLVEVISTVHTSDATATTVREVLETLGKTPIFITDRAGFVVNALLITYLNDAIRLYGERFATREDMDEAMVAVGNPMGPLTLADLIGNDVNLAIMERMVAETGRPLHTPAPLLVQVNDDKMLGRKTGRGFYTYDGSEVTPLVEAPEVSRKGEVADRLLACYLNEALRMVEDGYATPAQVDTGMMLGCRMPAPFDQIAEMGPQRLLALCETYAAHEPELAPVALLRQLAEADDPAAALAELRQR